MINNPETNIHINNNSTVLKVQKPSNGSTQSVQRSADYIDLEMITEVFFIRGSTTINFHTHTTLSLSLFILISWLFVYFLIFNDFF